MADFGARSFTNGAKRIEIDEERVGAILAAIEEISGRLSRPLLDKRSECVALIALARTLAEEFSADERKRIFEEGMAMSAVLSSEMESRR